MVARVFHFLYEIMHLTLFLLFAVTANLSFFLTFLALKLAPKVGFYDQPGERKIHDKPIPYGGGVAIFLSIFLVLGSIALYIKLNQPHLPSYIKIHLKGLFDTKIVMQLLSILTGVGVIFLVGLIDDIKPLKPSTKMLLILVAAVLAVVGGTQITAFISIKWLNVLITILWITGLTNSFNLLDNMDGLSSGVALIICLILAAVTIQNGELFTAAFTLVIAGAIGGFLVWNFNPARIFLGDSGSLMIGYLVSILTILPTFYSSNAHGQTSVLNVFMPLVLLAVPIFDTFSVIFIRLKNKKSIFMGDKNHFSHRLVKLGLSRRQAVLVIYLVCLNLGISGLVMSQLSLLGGVILTIQALLTIIMIVIFENAGRKKNNDI